MTGESGNYLVHCITYKSLKSLQYFVERGADLESVCEKKNTTDVRHKIWRI